MRPKGVVSAFVEHDGVALVDAQGALGYAELRALVVERARDAALGAPGQAVPIVCGGARQFLVDVLAAWTRGAAVFPVDARLPSSVADKLVARLLPVPVEAMLVLATSGSSGPPKLVVLSAHGTMHNIDAILRYLPVRDAACIGLCSPLTYSYGLVGQALTTFAAGSRLVDLTATAFPAEQMALAREHGVQGISSVPTQLRRWLRVAEEAAEPMPMRFVASAGAHLDSSTAARVRVAFPGAELFRQYGLTECSPRVAAISDRDAMFEHGATGKPIAGTECRVLRADGAPAPAGEEGALWVRSPSCMMHYLGDPEATARVLGADGWLCTGDTARVDAHGYLSIAGRNDGVVKCAGERVSTEEVAEVIRGIAGVLEAVVIAVPHDELGWDLHAYVHTTQDEAQSIRAQLRALLAPAKRPSRVVCMGELPKLANGKWDMVALREKGQR